MNEFKEHEFSELCERFKVKPYCKDICIKYERHSFFDKMRKSVESDRRGEVVFCVIRPCGKLIAITCAEYPEGIFRIPTGGIGHSENIEEAVYREVKEELGLDTQITHFAGVLKLKFAHEDQSFMFYSYMFVLKETGGTLLADASDDEISEIKEVDLDGLEQICDGLIKIEGDWSDWGKFRYESCRAVLEYLQSEGIR